LGTGNLRFALLAGQRQEEEWNKEAKQLQVRLACKDLHRIVPFVFFGPHQRFFNGGVPEGPQTNSSFPLWELGGQTFVRAVEVNATLHASDQSSLIEEPAWSGFQ
jgi:hypothetical protein